ncbi:2OG-Fe(II) oxygenase family protein [Methylomicrobium sp. Wu6]|uniref:2OG-Fe(II) oxygenase family protein n=1 Tax=Methylomicrobium sp. Wu6 TaxID=3107928 RepID=UPI002DD633EF|nr:2OG-Fe(II) oxygenase family protein [Methylomicrobium sp. Wu6]MEC4749067.1 2OG-Fe(II) oxygenase family protein [Methylomicrobium sp. Wu6]
MEDAEALNAQLLAEALARRAASPGLDRSNWQGWHSEDDFFGRTEPGCRVLQDHIVQAVQICTMNISPSFDFTHYQIQAEGWINVLPRGGLNTPHDHPAWVWSGCYYVSVPVGDKELSGNIEFFDTRTNVRTLTVDGAACFASKFVMKPRAGMLLMFPSYLRHWVYPNDSDEDRVTIAFNLRFARNAQS